MRTIKIPPGSLAAVLLLGAAAALLVPAHLVRDPLLARLRPDLIPALWAISGVLVLIGLLRFRRSRWPLPVVFVLCAAALGLAHAREAEFAAHRARVLAAPAAELGRIGSHLVVGAGPWVDELLERDALGGVYLSKRYASGRSTENIRKTIRIWQERRARRGQPPLWIAVDQEGGLVSGLSPPLPQRPALGTVLSESVRAVGDDEAIIDDRIQKYAQAQARDLAALGVNLNFSPVVDLRGAVGFSVLDFFGRIDRRSPGTDSERVARAARAYVRGSAAGGVYATLKHFPGLGRVAADTHFFEAVLTAAPDELRGSDWRPYFETLADCPTALVMLAHVRLFAVDATRPASLSPAVVRVLRAQAPQVVLITDDLNMFPTARGGMAGLGRSAVRALQAGVDLLLVSYDGENAFPVLSALLAADRAGHFDARVLAVSARRLAGLRTSPSSCAPARVP